MDQSIYKSQCEVVADFGDGTYKFYLNVARLQELEEKCNAAFTVIYKRLLYDVQAANDIIETLRLGLIGGGMEAVKAKKLVDRYAMPLGESAPIARAVMTAAVFGKPMPPDQAKKEWAEMTGPMSLEEFRTTNLFN